MNTHMHIYCIYNILSCPRGFIFMIDYICDVYFLTITIYCLFVHRHDACCVCECENFVDI